MSKIGFLVKSVAFAQISPKLTFTKMTLFIYGPMQLNELIPNISLVEDVRVRVRVTFFYRVILTLTPSPTLTLTLNSLQILIVIK
jgi:hypothetical protein